MAVETATELSAIVNSNDFGVTATFDSNSISGIFDNEFIESDGGLEAGIGYTVTRFICKTSDVSGASFGDTIIINSVAYKIREIRPDGTGMSELIIEV